MPMACASASSIASVGKSVCSCAQSLERRAEAVCRGDPVIAHVRHQGFHDELTERAAGLLTGENEVVFAAFKPRDLAQDCQRRFVERDAMLPRSLRIFILCAGMVHSPASRLNSCHRAPRVSHCRPAVSTVNSGAPATMPRCFRSFCRNSGTSDRAVPDGADLFRML